MSWCTLTDCASVCVTGQLSHKLHRITGHTEALGADLGMESSEKPPSVLGGTEASPHSA